MKLLRHALVATTALLALPAAAQTASTVDAPAGRVQGSDDAGISVYKGLPYAMPPVGARRWQPPVPMPRWSGVRQATAFGPACVQPTPKGQSVYSPIAPLPTSEDCLTLNVWVPPHAEHAPVFFWIHGGALVTGSSREATYDGEALAKRGVIVVSINYRLGVLGWLAHPELSAETRQHVSGNYGLLDQVEALQWVHRNIAAFGGDPSQVTIAGESAGALSVLYLMTSPAAHGLFNKAVSESGYMISMPDLKHAAYGAPSAEAIGQMLQAGLHAPDLAAMRAMDPQQLTDSAAALGFPPFGTVDGYVLPEQMVTAFGAGRQAHVPVLVGFNQGEIRSLRMLLPKPPASAAEYEKTIRAHYGELADNFLRLYPASDYAESMLATTRDALYGWTAERVAHDQTAAGENAFLYLFDHGYPAMDDAGLHAFHASELPYVFGTTDRLGPGWPKIPATPAEQGLSNTMTDYWASFAATGTPSSRTGPAWPAFGQTQAYMHFAATPQPETGLMPGMFALNDAVVCRRLATGRIGWNWNVGLASPDLPPKAAGCD